MSTKTSARSLVRGAAGDPQTGRKQPLGSDLPGGWPHEQRERSVPSYLSFVVEGPPVPWQRAMSKGGQRFTSAKQRKYQRLIALVAAAHTLPRTGWHTDARYAVELDVYQQDRKRRDLDNFQKQLGDACNAVLWDDDSQIDEWHSRRYVSRERPRIEVRVYALDGCDEADRVMHGDCGDDADTLARAAGLADAAEAWRKLDAGELDGTRIEMRLKMLRHVRGDSALPLPPRWQS